MKKLLFFSLTITLISCHQIHDGKVTGKELIPAHSYIYSTMLYAGKRCIPIMHTGYAEDEYVLTVTKRKGKKTITEKFSVSKETFECKIIGSNFNDTIPCEVYEKK